MGMTQTFEAWRGVLAAFERSFVFVGAFLVGAILLAAPAHAQAKFNITDGSGVVIKATLTNGNRTLTFKGPQGTFVFKYEQEYDTQTHIGYEGTGTIEMVRWPKGGRGQLIAYI